MDKERFISLSMIPESNRMSKGTITWLTVLVLMAIELFIVYFSWNFIVSSLFHLPKLSILQTMVGLLFLSMLFLIIAHYLILISFLMFKKRK